MFRRMELYFVRNWSLLLSILTIIFIVIQELYKAFCVKMKILCFKY